jgi:hypothetical protein
MEDADRFDDVILPENYEWENLTGGGNENEDGAPPPLGLLSTVTIVVNIKKDKVNSLKELFKKFDIAMPQDKKKASLFTKLRDSGKVKKIDEESFSYKEIEVPRRDDHKGPWWEILTGVEVALPAGFHKSGGEMGYFAPTNKNSVTGSTKFSYLTGEDERIK